MDSQPAVMRIGISINSSYPDVDGRSAARRMIERARAARTAGLRSLFVGDHHVVGSTYLQNTPILGRLLAEWNGPVFGALYLLPLTHPVLLAEHTSTLACLGEGRFVLQCGLGDGERQFSGLGVRRQERVQRFEASLETLRALWSGETVDSAGPWSFQGARIAPLPPAMPEVWVGAFARVAIERAARLAEGWIASPSLTLSEGKESAAIYREACERSGRSVPRRAVLRRDVLVAETQEEAERLARPVVGGGYRGFPSEALWVGSPETVRERILAWSEAGYEEVLVRNLSQDQEVALRSIELLQEVS
ncbi:MAG: LLM class flavin-dependent oxidoreductase [Acidobacteriota bacterium]